MVVLGTKADDRVGWLGAGQALGKMVVIARSENVWTSFMNQPIEVPDLRSRLLSALGRMDGFPQLLMRIGHSRDVKPIPRRTLVDVLRSYISPS